jgi:hypothetical protein
MRFSARRSPQNKNELERCDTLKNRNDQRIEASISGEKYWGNNDCK